MIKQNLTLGTTASKKKKNNGTGGLYGDFIGGTGSANNVSLPNLPSSNPTYGDFINIPTPSKSSKSGYIGAYTGEETKLPSVTPALKYESKANSYGYSDYIGDMTKQPTISSLPNNQVAIKKPEFDSNVVGTVGGGFSGGKKGGVTDDGEIIGSPSVDNSTFNKGNNTVSSGKLPTSKSDKIPTPTIEEPVIKPSIDTIKDGSTGGETQTPSTPTEKKPETTVAPATYEEYIEAMKKGYQEQLDAANKQAEQTKARAMADAENAYAQNKATYGTNAETLAQMGLTGGGYSDYLQAQAYAQKRADAQAATAQEIASKSNNQATYQQYIQAMNEKLAENALYNERLADQRKYQEEQTAKERELEEEMKNTSYSKAAYLEALSQIQNSTTRENYSEEGIRILGKQWGWSDEQINDLLSIYKNGTGTSTGSDNVSLDGNDDENSFSVESTIKAIEAGRYGVENDDGTYTKYSREQLYEICLQARNAKKCTDQDVQSIMKAYDRRVAYENNKISMDEYYNAANKDAAAEKEVDKILNADYYKSKVGSYGYNQKDARDVLFTTSDKFNISQFGSYTGSGYDGKQDNYLKKIVADAKAGKIKEGQYIVANYGSAFSSMGYFLYVGDGVFVKLYDNISSSAFDDYNPTRGKSGSLYVPDGYRWKGGQIKKK